MDRSDKRGLLWRIAGQIVFVSIPAILLSGFAVFKGRDFMAARYGITVSDLMYALVLFLTMYCAYYFTSRKILGALQTGKWPGDGDIK